MGLMDKNISQLLHLMDLNEVSSEEIVKECISNIEMRGEDSDIYQVLLKDDAINKSKEIDRKRKNNEVLGSLAGIPFVVTDEITTKGILTTAGSKILENYIPPFDATVMEKIKEDNGVMLGKVKVEEFGLMSTDNIYKSLDLKGAVYGIGTSMDPRKISMKPTYGLISRYGVIGATSSFDQVVPITNCVEDMAFILNSIAGFDKKDSTSVNMDKVDYRKYLTTGIKGIKIAIPTDLFEGEYNTKLGNIINKLENLGATVQKVSLSTLGYILPVYNILSSAEFASNSARYEGISLGYRTKEYVSREELYKKTRAEGFGKEAKKRMLFGNYVISSSQYEKSYKKAQKVRALIKEEFTQIVDEYGLLMLPFTSKGYDNAFNIVANVTGLPSITVPYGIQFVGPAFKEEELIRIAYNLDNGISEVEDNA